MTWLNSNNKGFTLAEMLIVVAIMAAVLTMAFPDVVTFFQLQEEREEAAEMFEIQKAMRAYADDRGELPIYNAASPTDWAEELAEYTNLSTAQIANDTWDQARVYRAFTRNVAYREGVLTTYYATLMSFGREKCKDLGTTTTYAIAGAGCHASADVPAAAVDFYGATDNDRITTYQELLSDVNGDDVVVKFTDVQIKTDRYLETVKRLEAVTEALEVYARSRYNEEASDYGNCVVVKQRFDAGLAGTSAADVTAACDTGRNPTWTARIAANTTPDRTIYYPSTESPVAADAAFYAPIVDSDAANFIDDAPRNEFKNYSNTAGTVASAAQRRGDVQKLMRLLGLPETYCCSALENDDDGAPKAFYYFSNPRPRTSSTACGARPAVPPYLPARVVLTYVVDGTAGVTCG